MYFGLDANGIRTLIDDSLPNTEYFCPICSNKLIRKTGTIRSPHFAHMKGFLCDEWNYDMSEWHRSWQDCFPLECREIIIELEGTKHRADVVINNTVIEFQHSPLSSYEFEKRNEFYNLAGYKVVWLFDFREKYDNGQIYLSCNKDNMYCWKWASSTFVNYNPKNSINRVYFQISDEESEFEIVNVSWKNKSFSRFITNSSFDEKEDFIRFVNDTLPNFSLLGKPKSYDCQTLYELIHSCRNSVIIAKNVNTGYRVKIGADQYRKNYSTNHEIYGYLGKNSHHGFYDDRRLIYECNKRVWIFEWGST